MAKLIIRPSRIDDAYFVGRDLREGDRREILLHGHDDPVALLARSREISSVCWTGCDGDTPMSMFGAVPDSAMGDRACVWMLGTPLLRRHSIDMVKVTRRFFAGQLRDREVLYNFVDSRYTEAIRWLKLCGANFIPARDQMASGVRVCYFEVKKGA